MMENQLRTLVDESLAEGWKMSKLLHKGYWIPGGFLTSGSWVDSNYDSRIVYNREDLQKLVKEGFGIDGNIGIICLNILFKAKDSEETKPV